MSEINVLVVEDEPLIAEDIRQCLTHVDYAVQAVAHDKESALAALAALRLDIVLLDINLGGKLAGFEIAEVINATYHLPFVYLSSYSNSSILEQAKYTRPMGYIVKPFDEADLFTSIEIALYNFANLRRPSHLSRENVNEVLPESLTEKEFTVLEDIYLGLTNKQMCEKHFISLNTIKTHLKSIYAKMDVHSRTEAMAKVRELLG